MSRPRSSLVAALAGVALALTATPARATTYYVSPTGDDAAAGTAPEQAWRTLARPSRATLRPGDRVLLQGGATFTDALSLESDDAGAAADPVVVGSFGSGRATIRPASGPGVVVYNTAGVRLQDLDVRGPGRAVGSPTGIVVYNDLPGDVLLAGITIQRVSVSSFGHSGIGLGGWNGRSGFRDVLIQYVRATDNGRQGVSVYAAARAVNVNVTVRHTIASGNTGVPGLTTNSGSGIVLGNAARSRIQRSVAHHNGASNTAAEGPAGIWVHDSQDVVVERNESYANRTAGPTDGDGFDLDQNTGGSVLRFNYSHDNDGAGFLVSNGPDTALQSGNAIHHNVSENDGRRNGYGAIQVYRRAPGLRIEHNTVFLGAAAPASANGIVFEEHPAPGAGEAPITVRNTVLMATAGQRLVDVRGDADSVSGLRFEANDYFAGTGGWRLRWGPQSFSSLAAWRAATGQERLAGADLGTDADPRVALPGGGGTIGDATRLESLAAYRLQPGSPLIDAGSAAVQPGGPDFFGAPALAGVRPDVGASEAPAIAMSAPVASADPAVVSPDAATAAQGLYSWCGGTLLWSVSEAVLPPQVPSCRRAYHRSPTSRLVVGFPDAASMAASQAEVLAYATSVGRLSVRLRLVDAAGVVLGETTAPFGTSGWVRLAVQRGLSRADVDGLQLQVLGAAQAGWSYPAEPSALGAVSGVSLRLTP